MPKIGLRYTGDDEAMVKRLEATDGVQMVEPIDAREILSTPGNEYEIDEESRKMIGELYDPRMQGDVNVPQLHGMDAELQTGLSAEKYGRNQVVKAVPEGSMPTAMQPMTTTGRPLNLEEARKGEYAGAPAKAEPAAQSTQQQDNSIGGGSKAPSEGMSAEEMRQALTAKNVQFPPDAKKAELAELVDRHNARKA